jgi:uncharacterized BrkB/YihY/UPF0761 family membrane protein
MKKLKQLLGRIDTWQQKQPVIAPTYGMVKKFSNDKANLYVVSLGWYGFLSIFPLLLAVVTIFGFIGQKSLGSSIVTTLHKFPVIGTDFNPQNNTLHGSVIGLIVGLAGLIYGAQGVTQQAEAAMIVVWDIGKDHKPGFAPRLARSLIGLLSIGGAFVISAFASTYATSSGESLAVRVPVIAALLVVNVGFYMASFRALTPTAVGTRSLLPGAILGSLVFTLLTTLGTGLINHQLRNASGTYGSFGSVIGLVAFLLLLAKLSVYAAELNSVLAKKLYPRSFLPEGFVDDPKAAEGDGKAAVSDGRQHA